MGFFSSIGSALKSIGPKLLRGLRKLGPKVIKGIKSGSKAVVKGIKRLFRGKPNEATAKVGREVIRTGKRGKNLIKKARPKPTSKFSRELVGGRRVEYVDLMGDGGNINF